MANITVGPAFEVGGNTVEMTTKGKLQITNSKGKVKTLSQDEFKKNLVKNVDKINNGEDFEFKKDRKGLKIFGAALATAVVATSVIYRKQIAKFFKEFSFKKLYESIKNIFKENTPPGYSKEYRNARKQNLKETFANYDSEAICQELSNGKTPKEFGIQSRKSFIPNNPDKELIKRRKTYEAGRQERKQKFQEMKKKFEEMGIHFNFKSKLDPKLAPKGNFS